MDTQTDAHYYLDKMQIASVRLADTLYGFFSGNHPATTIDNARAVSEVLKGIKCYLHSENEIDDTYLEFEDRDPFTHKFKLLSNFTKHSDRDTSKLATMDEKTASVALIVATSDYRALISELMEKRYIEIDESAWEEWHNTDYGNGNSTMILCNLFDMWDQDNFGLDIVTQEDGVLQQLYEHTWENSGSQENDPEKIRDLLNQAAEMMEQVRDIRLDKNSLESKRKWRDVADELNLWPVAHHGGLKLARNKGVEFAPHDQPLAES